MVSVVGIELPWKMCILWRYERAVRIGLVKFCVYVGCRGTHWSGSAVPMSEDDKSFAR